MAREDITGLAAAQILQQPDLFGSFQQGAELARKRKIEDFQRKLQAAGIIPASSVAGPAKEVGLDLSQQEDIPTSLAVALAEQARLARKPAVDNSAQLDLQLKRLELAKERLGFEREKTADQPERQAKAASKKLFNEQKTAISSLDKSLALLENAANAIGGNDPGVLSQASGKASAAVKGFAAQPKMRNFQQSVDTTLAEIARGPLKQKGVLTDRDIDLARGVISRPEEPLNNKKASIERLRYQSFSNLAASAQTAGEVELATKYNQIAEASLQKMNELLGIKTEDEDLSSMSTEDLIRAAMGGK